MFLICALLVILFALCNFRFDLPFDYRSKMEGINRKRFCCNPFQKPHHWKATSSDLRTLSTRMLEKFPNLNASDKVCSSCRKEIYKMRSSSPQPSTSGFGTTKTGSLHLQQTAEEMEEEYSELHDTHDEQFYDVELILDSWNECLLLLGQQPIDKKRKQDKGYVQRTLKNFVNKMSEVIFDFSHESEEERSTESEIIENMRNLCAETDSTETRLTVLSLLPKNWTVSKIMAEFANVSQRLVRKSKEFSKHPHEFIERRKVRTSSLSALHEEIVRNFYNSDEISRIMPGKKDYISIKVRIFCVNELLYII